MGKIGNWEREQKLLFKANLSKDIARVAVRPSYSNHRGLHLHTSPSRYGGGSLSQIAIWMTLYAVFFCKNYLTAEKTLGVAITFYEEAFFSFHCLLSRGVFLCLPSCSICNGWYLRWYCRKFCRCPTLPNARNKNDQNLLHAWINIITPPVVQLDIVVCQIMIYPMRIQSILKISRSAEIRWQWGVGLGDVLCQVWIYLTRY